MKNQVSGYLFGSPNAQGVNTPLSISSGNTYYSRWINIEDVDSMIIEAAWTGTPTGIATLQSAANVSSAYNNQFAAGGNVEGTTSANIYEALGAGVTARINDITTGSLAVISPGGTASQNEVDFL